MFAGNYEQSVDQIVRLEKELRHSIAEKEAKYTRLSELQNHIDSEVQELTEKLFQEAYRMVNDAESRRAKAEKLLLKVDYFKYMVYMLVAEVEALKVIVMSPVSSSSSQVTHISQRTGLALRFLGSTRNFVIVENDLVVEIKGERHSSASSYKIYTLLSFGWDSTPTRQSEKHEPVSEIDPIYHRELTQWRKRGASGDDSSPFLSRIIAEDVCRFLNFNNIKKVLMSIYTPRNVLVTGGCGFIGSNFVNYIFRTWPQTNIVNIDKLTLNADVFYVNEEVIESSRYKLITADIRNCALVERILNENKIDTVIHFATDCTSTRCYDDPVESIENNVIAFIQFMKCIQSYKKIERFLHISTDEVYGDSNLVADEKGKIEDAVLLPGNPYAATKAACESYAHICCDLFAMPIIILRINNIYGPNQWDVKVIPRFIKLAKNMEKFTVQGSGKQLRSWLYVDDAAEGIRKAVESGKIHEIYNIGTYFEMNVIDLAHVIQAEVDRQLGRSLTPVEFVGILDRPYNDLRYLLDYSKISLDTGWSPKVSFEEGISRVIVSALNLPKRSQKMTVVIYGGKGWIGQQCCKKLLERKIHFTLAKCRVGKNSDKEVLDELNGISCTHVLCCTGRTHGGKFKTVEYLEGGPNQTFENIRDNLYSTVTLARICQTLGLHFTYVGTGYIFAYDQEHPIGGKGFTDDDLPTFFGNSYSIVKGFTDRMIQQYHGGIKECLNARITLPLNFCLDEERNLLTKILGYKQIFDIPVSITILDDCIPALIDLMERRVGGNLNLVNPQPISFSQILELYKEIVCSDIHHYELLDANDDKYRELCTTKGNCALDTSKLEKLCPKIPNSFDSLRKGFMKIRDNLN